MDIQVRVPDADQFTDFMAPVWAGFGDPEPSKEEIADTRALWEQDRSLGVMDDGRWVAGTGAFSFDLTVPGGAALPVAGVTMVGVASTHRRRGLLTALMHRQLDDVADRGEAFAGLTASETVIYGRFGYGLAASVARYDIETDRSRFAVAVEDRGQCRLLRRAEAPEPFAVAYERCRLRRAGTISRSAAWWELRQRDHAGWPAVPGAGATYWLLHVDAAGEPDGGCTYRIKQNWPDRVADNTVVVEDLFGVDDDVEAALWRHVLDVDLAGWVQARCRPVDDPLRWRLGDLRRLRTKWVSDWLWLRLLDVPAALSARTYAVEGSLCLEVVDDFRPATAGCYRLDGSPEGATCAATRASPDVTLHSRDLAAAYLGGVAVSNLAAAGRLDEHRPGALARADTLFVTHPAPFCGTMF